MKKKLLFVLAIVFALTLSLCLTACNLGGGGNGGDTKNPPNTTGPKYGKKDFTNVDLTPLANLTDYGNSATANAVTYDAKKQADQVKKLQEKQAELKDDLDDRDEDYSTYNKIFKRADANEIVRRMSVAGLPEEKMVALVEYISREDSVVPADLTVMQKIKQEKYVFEAGKESLIRDYEDIDELQAYYDDFDSKPKEEVGSGKEREDNEHAVYDALALKRRKVSKESILIFKTDADQYARTMLEELLYANKVVDERADLEYGEGGDREEKYINYFRDIYFDYETLSFMLAFNETVELVRDSYIANKRADFVRLYAYHYQYQKKDTESFTDAEHKEYLALSHKSYMSDNEAIRYRELDSQSYKNAYRYTDGFYKTYMGLYLTFQGKQEAYDKQIYVGGSNNQYANGLGSAKSGSTDTYSSEMRSAIQQNIKSVLKISDTEHQYFLFQENIVNMNHANTAWNSLTESEQAKTDNKLSKVNLEVENLKLQDYSLNYKSYLDDNDFVGALQYQVKSFSADYIRTIQANKKKDVTLNKELDRLYARNADQSEIDAKIEEIGRNSAMYVNLSDNYSGANISGQMDLAAAVEWSEIRKEVKDALEKDYKTYHQNNRGQGAVLVDEYFEDNLIKKKYSCGGTKDNCLKKNSHINCTKDYDTECRISRTINNHENVFRYVYGRVEITYRVSKDLTTYQIDEVSDTWTAHLGIGNGFGTYAKDATTKPDTANSNYVNMKTETLDSDEKLTLASYEGKWAGFIPDDGNLTISQKDVTVDRFATVTYTVVEKNASTLNREVTYEYHLEFDGWFVDKQLQWRADPEETFSYDIRLYAGYRITKTEKKN